MQKFTHGLPDLAAIRENRGVSLRHIADSTGIRLGYLESIERGDLQDLPGGVYTKSYVRQYARAIDYDEQELLSILLTDMDPAEDHEAHTVSMRQQVSSLLTFVLNRQFR